MVVYTDSPNEPTKKEKKKSQQTQSPGAMPNRKSRYKICIIAVYTGNEYANTKKKM